MSRIEAIYCWAVGLCAAAWVFLVPFAFAKKMSRSMEPLFIGSFLSLAALFPVGILLELFHWRWPIPRRVGLCFTLTLLAFVLLAKAYRGQS